MVQPLQMETEQGQGFVGPWEGETDVKDYNQKTDYVQ